MKKFKMIIAIAVMLSMVSFNVFAAEGLMRAEKSSSLFKDHKKEDKAGEKDPVKRLEKKKEFIEERLKDGTLTKEKADEMTDRIDKHIEQIKEFNSLPLPQKKEQLSGKFRKHIEENIKDGKLTQEEGEKLLKEFDKNLENWDGKEFPNFMKKGGKHGGSHQDKK